MVMWLRAEDTSSSRQRLHSYATKGTKGTHNELIVIEREHGALDC